MELVEKITCHWDGDTPGWYCAVTDNWGFVTDTLAGGIGIDLAVEDYGVHEAEGLESDLLDLYPSYIIDVRRPPVSEPEGKNYLLRNIPPGLHAAAKHRAVDEGVSFRELIFRALREYLKKGA